MCLSPAPLLLQAKRATFVTDQACYTARQLHSHCRLRCVLLSCVGKEELCDKLAILQEVSVTDPVNASFLFSSHRRQDRWLISGVRKESKKLWLGTGSRDSHRVGQPLSFESWKKLKVAPLCSLTMSLPEPCDLESHNGLSVTLNTGTCQWSGSILSERARGPKWIPEPFVIILSPLTECITWTVCHVRPKGCFTLAACPAHMSFPVSPFPVFSVLSAPHQGRGCGSVTASWEQLSRLLRPSKWPH